MEKVIYNEVQRFRQWWMWAIILLVDAGLVVALVFDRVVIEANNKPIEVWEILLISAVSGLLTAMFLTMKLKTRIDEEGIHVKFTPFHLKEKHFHWRDLSKAYVRSYSPLWEYGGWGIKYGPKGKAYNVSGKEGLQLELQSGKRVLIGTSQPGLIDEAVSAYGFGRE